ncbi:MAG: helix-turn-helix domain-containing protein [Ardenticatenaceae bacterium]|nr:helix-turn-helix domain-containing protein [Ardenticatenaceae bacterium]
MPRRTRFSQLLDRARRQSRLSQQELADRVADVTGTTVSQQRISQWCTGETRPRERTDSLALCRALYRAGGLRSLAEVNELLRAADEGALHQEELAGWLPELLDPPGGGRETEYKDDEVTGVGCEPEAEKATLQQPGAGSSGPGGLAAPTKDSQDPKQWYTRVVEQVAHLLDAFKSPERHGMVGAIAVSTLLLGTAWQSPASLGGHPAQVILLAGSLWASTLLLALPPSPAERAVSGRPLWRRKLYRLSGAACAVFILAGLLLWAEALAHLLMSTPLPREVTFLLTALGAIFAYAGAAHVQQSFSQDPADQRFYTQAAAQVSAMMIVAQGMLVGFLAVTHLFWSNTVFLLVLVPAGWMLLRSLRRR